MSLRLTLKDKRVIAAFTERQAAYGTNLATDGQRLDGHWMGGNGIAVWGPGGKIVMPDLGSKAAQTVQNAVKREAPTNWFAGLGSTEIPYGHKGPLPTFVPGEPVRYFKGGRVYTAPYVGMDPDSGNVILQERGGRVGIHPHLVRKDASTTLSSYPGASMSLTDAFNKTAAGLQGFGAASGGRATPNLRVEGTRWRDSYGNTYHRAYIYVGGRQVGVTDITYGYDRQYLETARNWLIANGYRDPGLRSIYRSDSEAHDVRRKRDL